MKMNSLKGVSSLSKVFMSRGRGGGLTVDDGRRAVELAREAVRKYVSHGQRADPGSMRDAFYTRSGAVVRLETADGRKQLRGCEAEPDRPGILSDESVQLGHAIVDASVKAASDSSRGEVKPTELSNLCVSVFCIGEFEPTADPVSEIEVGTHGIAIEGRETASWMFPSVPVDQGWSTLEYLDRTATKAGLPRDAWEDEDVQVLKLDGQLFVEREPNGSVTERLDGT